MAWKFRPEHYSQGEVCNPTVWRDNVNEALSEVNGFLDNDNLSRESLQSYMIKRNTFTEVFYQDTFPSLSFLFDHSQSGWLKRSRFVSNDEITGTLGEKHLTNVQPTVGKDVLNYNTQELPHFDFNADYDGMLIVEFCGWCQWTTRSHFYQFIDSDNFPGHCHDWSYYKKQTKNYKLLSAYILVSQWRITVNGASVCETGFLGNEYAAHPLYMCGAIPVSKGKNQVAQLEARFGWYAPGTDEFIDASSWIPGGGKVGKDDLYVRRDCVLHSSNLIGTFRKR